jgi:MFS family permease
MTLPAEGSSSQAAAMGWERSPFASPARRIRWVLFAAMALTSAASIAVATVNSIVGATLGGTASWAGVPAATILIGSALAAPLWGRAFDHFGRRAGLAVGLGLGALGSAWAVGALTSTSMAWFIGGLVLVGASSAAIGLSRFVAGEVHPAELRARAISTVVLGGAIGAIVGPLLVAPSGQAAAAVGWSELVGPFAASLGLQVIATVLVVGRLRPEPGDLGRQVAAQYSRQAAVSPAARPIGAILRGRETLLAVTTMVVAQMVMVAVMVMTGLHMRDHHHGLASISLVTGAHTFGMYAFSVFSGRLADRRGRKPIIAFGAATLVLACLAAPLSPDVLPLAVILFLLGLGWNFCYVGGSALLTDQLRPAERARTQGVNDLLIGLGSAAASLGGGLVYAAVGYAAMAWVGALAALIPLALAMRSLRPAPAAA